MTDEVCTQSPASEQHAGMNRKQGIGIALTQYGVCLEPPAALHRVRQLRICCNTPLLRWPPMGALSQADGSPADTAKVAFGACRCRMRKWTGWRKSSAASARRRRPRQTSLLRRGCGCRWSLSAMEPSWGVGVCCLQRMLLSAGLSRVMRRPEQQFPLCIKGTNSSSACGLRVLVCSKPRIR